jgi:hypothetical protein
MALLASDESGCADTACGKRSSLLGQSGVTPDAICLLHFSPLLKHYDRIPPGHVSTLTITSGGLPEND